MPKSDLDKEQLLNELTELLEQLSQFEGYEGDLERLSAGRLGRIHSESQLNSVPAALSPDEATTEPQDHEEIHWRRTFDLVSDLVWITDLDHRIVQFNKAAAEKLGKKPEEILGVPCYRVIHETQKPPDYCPNTLLMRDGKEHSAEVTEKTLGGWFIFSVYPLYDNHGKMIGSLHIAHDVTELKEAQEALRKSEERYRIIADFTHDWEYWLDEKGKLLWMSPSSERITGHSAQEFIDDPEALKNVVHPDDRNQVIHHMESRPNDLDRTHYLDFRIIDRHGKVRWINHVCRPVKGEHGRPLGVRVSNRDITKRKEMEEGLRDSEARLRAIFEGTKDCMFMKDASLKFTHVNPAVERLVGAPASELIGRTSEDLFDKETATHIKAIDLRVLQGEMVEQVHVKKIKGVPLTFHEVRLPMRDRIGQIVGLAAIARDITDWKNLAVPVASDAESSYSSAAMLAALKIMNMAAAMDCTVLLLGESGCGKDFFASYIHRRSSRVDGPFFSINCAAITAELAESELFGHERGAFTGAVGRKRGLLELAEGGTLVLNEIGDLPLTLQAKLLTFMDTRRFTRVGGEKEISVNARLIAATNKDLSKEVDKGAFRKDLYYRLNVMSVVIPPLRNRREDIPILVKELISGLARDLQLPVPPTVDDDLLKTFRQYRWPGNVRELRNVLERALILSQGGR